MEKAIFTDRAPILLHPEPANTWHWHAAPEWEVQAIHHLSIFWYTQHANA